MRGVYKSALNDEIEAVWSHLRRLIQLKEDPKNIN